MKHISCCETEKEVGLYSRNDLLAGKGPEGVYRYDNYENRLVVIKNGSGDTVVIEISAGIILPCMSCSACVWQLTTEVFRCDCV